MAWSVEFHEDFEKEFNGFSVGIQDELLANALILEEFGPQLSRPHVDTLNGSRHANMKELRFNIEREAWRVLFAFDVERKAIFLAGGDKKGKDEARFYKGLIKIADSRFDQHIKSQSLKEKNHGNSTSKSPKRTAEKKAGKNKNKGR